jgi:hypothetical protein
MASTDKIEAFLAEPRNVVVAGIRRDGRPHLSPNWDIAAELPRFRAIREKRGMAVPDDEKHLQAPAAEGRVLLAITPDKPPSEWTSWGLD